MREMAAGRYVVGIDLGTTNTAMARAELGGTSTHPEIRVVEIVQTVRPGAAEKRALLPSFVYLPAENELPAGSLTLPWSELPSRTSGGESYFVGELARERGAENPSRLASSAKSWLCQAGLDRRSPLLPWNANQDSPRLSPVEASALILQHLARVWEYEFANEKDAGKLCDQKIVLCVPASFDAAARELTLEAARMAGLKDVTLLEEPQAAFYAWIEQSRDTWRNQVAPGELILVVDIGGGTTDFSLIAVEGDAGALTLRRIAVGEHILLGGDNLDLALAHTAADKLVADGVKFDAWQLRALAHACREAKEKLFAGEEASIGTKSTLFENKRARPVRGKPQTQVSVAVLGRGTGVVGKTIKVALPRDEVEKMLLEGFFPQCPASERPRLAARTGLRDLSERGLNYAADPGITRHLAKFLAFETPAAKAFAVTGNAASGEGPVSAFACPSAILFNGGVMKSALLRERLLGSVTDWVAERGGAAPRELHGSDLELAVARGAAYFGLAQAGRGVRIHGGVPRSYYIGVESSVPAVPGRLPQFKALCVVPFGMEEGTEIEVPGAEFGLVVGEPAQFRFLTSTTRRNDRVGEAIENWNGEVRELAPLEAVLPATQGPAAGTLVPVRLRSRITTMGTLELWCREIGGAGAWKLELNLRDGS